MINRNVKTPLGQGVVQGLVNARLQDGTLAKQSVLVRLPINRETSEHLRDSNCWTPHAAKSALWLFSLSQVR